MSTPMPSLMPVSGTVPPELRPKQIPERATRPVYMGRVKLLNWADTAKSGMTSQLALLDINQEDIHPFKGLPTGNEYGQRLKVSLTESDFDLALDYEPQPVWLGECLLMRWCDDSYAGAQISLRLEDPMTNGSPSPHPLQGRRAGKKEGDEIYAVIWALSDEDAVMAMPAKKPRRPFNTLTATQQSQILSGDQTFQRWLISRLEEFLDADEVSEILTKTISDKELTAAAVKRICGIESRAELSQISPTALIAQRKWRALLEKFEAHRHELMMEGF